MDTLQHARELVSFESTSPLSNLAVSDYVENSLQSLDFATERIDFLDHNGVNKINIVGKKGKGSGGVAYFGHTDVVPAEAWFSQEHGPFDPVVKDGKLYGRGSCDMKGSIACMLSAAGQFSSSQLRNPIYLTCTADEEIGYGGARQVATRSQFFQEMVAGKSHSIIGEPTMLEVVYAHKGTYGFTAISHGRAAHSSTRKGINANLAMIPFLVEMKKIHDETEADSAWHNHHFDPPTISWNIGINDSTKVVNITPPKSICTVYLRPMPGQDADSLIDRAQQAAEKNGIEFKRGWSAPPLYMDPDCEFVRKTLQLARKEHPKTVSYGTDGAVFRDLSKRIVFGPGDIAQAHTSDEWITLDQLERGTQMFSQIIAHWCL